LIDIVIKLVKIPH